MGLAVGASHPSRLLQAPMYQSQALPSPGEGADWRNRLGNGVQGRSPEGHTKGL